MNDDADASGIDAVVGVRQPDHVQQVPLVSLHDVGNHEGPLYVASAGRPYIAVSLSGTQLAEPAKGLVATRSTTPPSAGSFPNLPAPSPGSLTNTFPLQ